MNFLRNMNEKYRSKKNLDVRFCWRLPMRVLPEIWDSEKYLYSFAETNAISSNENENREFEVEKTYPCKSTKFCHERCWLTQKHW